MSNTYVYHGAVFYISVSLLAMYVSQKQISPGNFASVLILLATWAHAIAFVAELLSEYYY